MEDYKIKANEDFFLKIIDFLNEGGVYFFPDAKKSYTKEGDVLVGEEDALARIKPIVSEEFYNKYFKIKSNEAEKNK